MKKVILTLTLMMSTFSFAQVLQTETQKKIEGLDNEILELSKERERKNTKLEECAKKAKGFKAAGISTLSLTAVGAGANIWLGLENKKLNTKIDAKTLAEYTKKISDGTTGFTKITFEFLKELGAMFDQNQIDEEILLKLQGMVSQTLTVPTEGDKTIADAILVKLGMKNVTVEVESPATQTPATPATPATQTDGADTTGQSEKLDWTKLTAAEIKALKKGDCEKYGLTFNSRCELTTENLKQICKDKIYTQLNAYPLTTTAQKELNDGNACAGIRKPVIEKIASTSACLMKDSQYVIYRKVDYSYMLAKKGTVLKNIKKDEILTFVKNDISVPAKINSKTWTKGVECVASNVITDYTTIKDGKIYIVGDCKWIVNDKVVPLNINNTLIEVPFTLRRTN